MYLMNECNYLIYKIYFGFFFFDLVGLALGDSVGARVGLALGCLVGRFVGDEVGFADGS
jgi:hypothetical protein